MTITSMPPQEAPEAAEAAEIDPRIEARRLAVARDARRRRTRRLAAAGVLTAFAVAMLGLVHSPLLDVDRVRVDGATQTGSETVRAASGVDAGAPLLLVDEGDVEARVEALPWVASASVRKRLPATIAITVVERTAVAVLSRGATHVLVDATGRALGTVASAPIELVAVEGLASLPRPGASTAAGALDAVRVAARLARDLPGEVRAVVAGEPLLLSLAEGGAAVLGSLDDLDAKLVAIAALLDQVDRTCLDTIDVRAPGTPVLTRRPECG